MEIVTSPWQPAPSRWSRLLVVLGIFAPVTLLALLPIGLGLERYVVSGDEMAPTIQRGAVLIERDVPVSDLRAGDVITFHPPGHAGLEGPVTRRIVRIEAGRALTRADSHPATDPWTVSLDRPTQQRVVVAVPYVGYVYLALVTPGPVAVAVATLLGAGGLAVATVLGRRRRAARP
ncbi:S26 family signal peptidase [Nocardioides sp. MAHUQ-72]|uniref:S26 family signal peptidase n=1 Tax=unclassified Nocardioides TaxID=2615069 RepID=UPI00361F8303